MSRVRDKADFQFAGEDYTHGSGVKYVANMIQTTDLTASGTITDIHLSDISDLVAPTSGNDGHYLKYDHATTRFIWGAGGGGGSGISEIVDDTSPQLGGNLQSNSNDIEMADNDKIALGTGERGKLVHTGASGKLQLFSTTGGIDIRTYANDEVIAISSDDGSGGIANYIIADGSTGATELYHYGSKKIETTSTGAEVTGSLTVSGDLTVNGTTTTINTTELTVSDNIITLNNDETGTPSQNAGIAVERGTSSNVDIRWNEGTDKWEFTNDGATYSDIGSADTGDISFSGSTITSSGPTVTVDDNLTVTGNFTSSQAGAPILTSASSLTLQASDRVHVNQSPLRLYNVTTTNRGNITASDGDLVYDSDVDSVFAFQNGSWTDIGGTFDGSASKFTVTAALAPSYPSSGEAILYSSYASGNTGIIIHGSGSNNVLQVRNGNSATDLMTVASDGDILASGSYTGSIKERSNADTSTSGTLDFNSKLFEIYRLTQNQTANRTLNIRGDGSTTLNDIMSNNEFRSIAVAFKNGGTPYYINAVTIDGTSVTPKWSGGSAPTGGNASSDDFYTFSIVKTGSATFEVYGTLTQFA